MRLSERLYVHVYINRAAECRHTALSPVALDYLRVLSFALLMRRHSSETNFENFSWFYALADSKVIISWMSPCVHVTRFTLIWLQTTISGSLIIILNLTVANFDIETKDLYIQIGVGLVWFGLLNLTLLCWLNSIGIYQISMNWKPTCNRRKGSQQAAVLIPSLVEKKY